MTWLDLIARWFHILPACILVGGSFYLYFAWFPGIADLSDETRASLAGVRRRWAMWVGIASGLLLISGFYAAAMASINYKVGPIYNGLLGLKILLGIGLMLLASLLSGRSPAAEKIQAKGRFWSGIAVLLAVSLVLIGGGMRFQNKESRPKKPGAPIVAEPEPVMEIELPEGDGLETPAPSDG